MALRGAAGRLEYLDGLRGVAALSVVFFHYFQRWPAYYPYEPIRQSAVLSWAFIGVWLFFVISGFVITLTLHRCKSLYEFAVRRFARLWPPMLLCSLLTYLILQLVPANPFPVSVRNFAPSLTFIDPYVFDVVLKSTAFGWMDGSYWSLFPEVQFYALVASVYFLQPHRFVRNILVVAGVVAILYAGAYGLRVQWLINLIQVLTVTRYLPLFIIGVGFYEAYVSRPAKGLFILGALGIVSQAIVADRSEGLAIVMNVLCVLVLAWLGMRTSVGKRLLSHPWITAVGAASYSLYLLHQRVGVAVIHWLGDLTGLRGGAALVLPLGVALAVTLLTMQIYRLWEAPVNRGIVALLCRPGPRGEQGATAPTPAGQASSHARQ